MASELVYSIHHLDKLIESFNNDPEPTQADHDYVHSYAQKENLRLIELAHTPLGNAKHDMLFLLEANPSEIDETYGGYGDKGLAFTSTSDHRTDFIVMWPDYREKLYPKRNPSSFEKQHNCYKFELLVKARSENDYEKVVSCYTYDDFQVQCAEYFDQHIRPTIKK